MAFVEKKERLSYIDMIRGLAIFLVVFVHIEIFSFYQFHDISIIGDTISLFHLPLFFFISGYVVNKTRVPNYGVVKNKFLSLVIPALVLGLFYTYFVLQSDWRDFMNDTSKMGYWFTFSLFEMFLIYYITLICIRTYVHKEKQNRSLMLALVVIGLIMFLCTWPMKSIGILNKMGIITCFHNTFYYFQFFCLGVVLSLCKQNLLKAKTQHYILAFIFLSFVLAAYFQYYGITLVGLGQRLHGLLKVLLRLYCGYCGVFFLFYFFKKNENIYVNNYIGKWLRYIGSKTFDIYLLHYFFLPTSIPLIGDYFWESKGNVLIEIFTGVFITLLVISCSLVLSSLIRSNFFLSKLLLGVYQK